MKVNVCVIACIVAAAVLLHGGDTLPGDAEFRTVTGIEHYGQSGGGWASLQQQAYLKASNTDGGNFFGWSVAISGDTVVVGANGEHSNATGR